MKYPKLHGFEVKAGGILFYRIREDGKAEFLLRNCMYDDKEQGFGDLGGKMDTRDCGDIYEMAAREAEEESNNVDGLFNKEDLKAKIKQQEGYYCAFAKYVFFYCEIDYIDPAKFGSKEECENIPHEYRWIEEGAPVHYHIRLQTRMQQLLEDFHRYLQHVKDTPDKFYKNLIDDEGLKDYKGPRPRQQKQYKFVRGGSEK